MNEAPVANRDAPLDRNVLLFRVLIADMTPPSLAHCSAKLTSQCVTAVELNKPEGVSNPQNCGWDREMNWCVSTAWRVFCSENNKDGNRLLKSGLEVHVEGGQFLGKGNERLWSQFQESITRLPHRLLGGR
jgi:hypothetical protein